MYNLQRN